MPPERRPPRRPRPRSAHPPNGFPTATRRRLDAELVRRGLAPSRARAHDDIAAGRVTVGGSLATKAARLVAPHEAVELAGPPPRFVSRGGSKLDAALERFAIDVAGRRALDVGSSTGGFTDALLQRGASSVVALDVGRHQLHERLRADARVTVHERTDVRRSDPSMLGAPFDVVVVDVSFISLVTVLDAVLALSAPGADLVALVKPQFEAGRAAVSKGRGVIRDPEVWRQVLAGATSALNGRRVAIMGAMASPLTGADGNVEFLLHGQPGPHVGPGMPLDIDALVADADAVSAGRAR